MNLRLRLSTLMLALAMVAVNGQHASAADGKHTVTRDIVYATVDGKPLKLDIYTPTTPASNPASAILRIGPTREELSLASRDLLDQGFTLVCAGYLPDAGERSANARVYSQFPADLYAAKAALRYVRGNASKFSIDKDRIAVWGAGHQGSGATLAALVGMTADRPEFAGALGDFTGESTAVRAMCLFEGTTDWRYAELYGDEYVNVPGTPAYQLFGGNPKEHPEDARQASAVNYIRPSSPATLMVTLASDEQRAMHLIFAETLQKAGVQSALYEVPATAAGPGGMVSENRGADDAAVRQTVVAFFKDTLSPDRKPAPAMTVDQEIDALSKAGLYKQARRLVEEQMNAIKGDDATALPQRTPWLRKLRQINDAQQEPALRQLIEAKRAGKGAVPDGTSAPRTLWTIREILTDPERIGQYIVEASVPQRVFASRADAIRYVQLLNSYLLKGNLAEADRQANVMRDMAKKGDADPAILDEFLTRYDAIRGKTSRVWPQGVRGVAFASDFGQDLFGFWMDLTFNGATQRMRYIPAPANGRFTMGSSKDEWGRLPGEPILESVSLPKGFWLGETEVTQALWEAVEGRDANHSAFKSNSEVRLKLPVENVSYAHAVNFLAKLNVDARLPSDAEWEYACRGGAGGSQANYMFAGTGRLSDMGWFWDEAKEGGGNPAAPTVDDKGDVDVRILHELETDRTDMARLTHPVKQKLPNRFGLFDMQGNVWEWCSGNSPDKPRDYHPAKGGSWISIPQSCRSARTLWLPTETQTWHLGFRICIPAP